MTEKRVVETRTSRINSPNRRSQFRKPQTEENREIYFAKKISTLIKKLKNLESTKQELLGTENFNFGGFFLLLDPKDTGKAYLDDFKEFVDSLNLKNLDEREIINLYSQSKSSTKIHLSLQDIADLVRPHDKSSEYLMTKKLNERPKNLDEKTKKIIDSLFTKLVEFNRFYLALKQELTEDVHLLNVLFESIDERGTRSLGKNDFLNFLQKSGIDTNFSRYGEFDIFFKECDLDKDGVVSFTDFYVYFSE